MKHHTITGGGGSRLHLVEAGDPRGQAILFIHGFSQSSLAWSRQLDSDLAHHYRLIAMDMRVDAVIRELDLDQPILSGWSYGPLVILDYIRHYGEDAIGGMQFVDGITRLGSEAALSVLTPEFLGLVPGFFSTDAEESVRSLDALLRMCFVHEPSPADLSQMLGYNVSVPPFVRQALFSRAFDNDDVLSAIRKPVLITHGAEDAIVKPSIVEQHRAAVPHAHVDIMTGAGHAAFWDDAASFNRRLGVFSDDVARRKSLAEAVAG